MFTRNLHTLPRQARLLSTSSAVRTETLAGKIKENIHAVDKAAGRTLASGIEQVQAATETVKEVLGQAGQKVEEKAKEKKEDTAQGVEKLKEMEREKREEVHRRT
ncbi:hypothetical protein DACRYDRAFT_107099 [Dacryopinax primogenitus]|uniref:Uncharacterized protein n=1 Tax=Dacryopinax primogenitus (strain DJM 731) TaxID=1858805 RepID=M5GD74_DACPD|nr:uncharacterized protein DACRYDRAFT_107099 [Dacryopinax primogenitus]EJU02163.1 hypothetical protein DACRYDRAFT_107099 [Dacryopinax primogenitus]